MFDGKDKKKNKDGRTTDKKKEELMTKFSNTAYYDVLEEEFEKNIEALKERALHEEEDISKVIACKLTAVALRGIIRNIEFKGTDKKSDDYEEYKKQFLS